MNTFLALNNSIVKLKEALNNIIANVTRDQMSLEDYRQKEGANTLVIDARQASINSYYDNALLIQELTEILPEIIEARIQEIKRKLIEDHSREIEQIKKQCPVCFPPSTYYPYFSEHDKEIVRQRSISELQQKMPKLF